MERIKVLTAAVALGAFTVDELVAFSGVKRSTVRSVLNRSMDIVEQLGPEAPERPGRPSSKWTVKDSEATREFIASIEALDPRPVSPSPISANDQHEAAVAVAENTITKIANRDPHLQRRILRSARATLNLVDTGQRAQSTDSAEPWWIDNDSPAAIRARAIDALAALTVSPDDDIADAQLYEAAHHVAEAIAVAPDVGESVYFAPFTQILASRGTLSPLLMVAPDIPAGLSLDKWTELTAEAPEPEPEADGRVLTQRWAIPLVGVAGSMPLVLVAPRAVGGEGWPRTLALLARWLERSRTDATPALVLGNAGQGDLARLAARFGAPFVPAYDWESAESVQLAAEAIAATVERHATQHAAGRGPDGRLLGTVGWRSPGVLSWPDDSLSAFASFAPAAAVQMTSTIVPIKALEDKILVQAQEAEQFIPSGLVIPDAAGHRTKSGKVLVVGPGRWDEDRDSHIPIEVAEGDTVIYSKYSGTEVKFNGDDAIIVAVGDILAVHSNVGGYTAVKGTSIGPKHKSRRK